MTSKTLYWRPTVRLLEVSIASFKNLRDFRVTFDQSSPYTVLVGENGSGKSNFIEALTLIFRNLDLDSRPPFPYRLKYVCRGTTVEIHADGTGAPRYWAHSAGQAQPQKLSKRQFMAEDPPGRPRYRPAFVFGYYSGPSDRLAVLYDKHRERFYNEIIRHPDTRKLSDPNSLRRLFYAQTLHGQFALLAFFMEPETGPDDDRAFLREHLQIDGLDSVLFALEKPPWHRQTGGDERFWHAQGEVGEFLSHLYGVALLPARMKRRTRRDLTKNPSVESLYLFLAHPRDLEEVYRSYGDQYRFFTALESTYLSRVLGEVRTRVRITASAGGGAVTYRDLSEGEQQLLLVLGLLKFTTRDETLFLLDEPDTHLNPAWSTQYLGFLDRFIRTREGHDNCHIVMASHDPLVFSGLTRHQVVIFRRKPGGYAIPEVPEEDPQGMGINAILTSDLFRLRSTLDEETQRKLDRRRLLAAKDTLSPEEENSLRSLNAELHGKGFTQAMRDPLYRQFLKAWTESEDPQWTRAVQLTPEQRAARAALADRIVRDLQAEKSRS